MNPDQTKRVDALMTRLIHRAELGPKEKEFLDLMRERYPAECKAVRHTVKVRETDALRNEQASPYTQEQRDAYREWMTARHTHTMGLRTASELTFQALAQNDIEAAKVQAAAGKEHKAALEELEKKGCPLPQL